MNQPATVEAYIAGFKRPIGLYPPVADAALRECLRAHAGPKGDLQFPLDEPMPLALIEQVVQARPRENEVEAAARRAR
jgi:hypothetical protein